MDLTAQQVAVLDRLQSRGFQIVAFPMYANYVGVRKGSCAALLAPIPGGGFSMYAKPTLLIAGNFTARLTREGRDVFVWKREQLEATPERLAELESFADALSEAVLPVE
jgi:hypothetical protein